MSLLPGAWPASPACRSPLTPPSPPRVACRSTQNLSDFLQARGKAGIANVDTRAITRRLRDTGALNGVIASDASIRWAAPPRPAPPRRACAGGSWLLVLQRRAPAACTRLAAGGACLQTAGCSQSSADLWPRLSLMQARSVCLLLRVAPPAGPHRGCQERTNQLPCTEPCTAWQAHCPRCSVPQSLICGGLRGTPTQGRTPRQRVSCAGPRADVRCAKQRPGAGAHGAELVHQGPGPHRAGVLHAALRVAGPHRSRVGVRARRCRLQRLQALPRALVPRCSARPAACLCSASHQLHGAQSEAPACLCGSSHRLHTAPGHLGCTAQVASMAPGCFDC